MRWTIRRRLAFGYWLWEVWLDGRPYTWHHTHKDAVDHVSKLRRKP